VNASINSLLANGLTTSSPAKRLAIYGQVLRQVATDVPYVVLLAQKSFTALSNKYTLPPFPVFPGFFSWALRLSPAA
jgi:ABC-type transport system substrate-binding protein